MYKEVKEVTDKTCTQIVFEYKGLAYLMLNPIEPIENGITLEPRGNLYAVADRNGLEQLYSTAKSLREQGIRLILETSPLDTDNIHVIL